MFDNSELLTILSYESTISVHQILLQLLNKSIFISSASKHLADFNFLQNNLINLA